MKIKTSPNNTQTVSSAEADKPVAETNPAETTHSEDDAHAREGSLVYRVAALIAMLILAITAFGLWLYFR